MARAAGLPPALRVRRTEIRLSPDQGRVVLRSSGFGSKGEYARIIRRVLALPEKDVRRLLDEVLLDFASRHRDLAKRLLARFRALDPLSPPVGDVSEARKLLI